METEKQISLGEILANAYVNQVEDQFEKDLKDLLERTSRAARKCHCRRCEAAHKEALEEFSSEYERRFWPHEDPEQ